jgi:hypothetical protein
VWRPGLRDWIWHLVVTDATSICPKHSNRLGRVDRTFVSQADETVIPACENGVHTLIDGIRSWIRNYSGKDLALHSACDSLALQPGGKTGTQEMPICHNEWTAALQAGQNASRRKRQRLLYDPRNLNIGCHMERLILYQDRSARVTEKKAASTVGRRVPPSPNLLYAKGAKPM